MRLPGCRRGWICAVWNEPVNEACNECPTPTYMKQVVRVTAHLCDLRQLKLGVISKDDGLQDGTTDSRVVRVIRPIPFDELDAFRRRVSCYMSCSIRMRSIRYTYGERRGRSVEDRMFVCSPIATWQDWTDAQVASSPKSSTQLVLSLLKLDS